MSTFGFNIVTALVTDISPNIKVKDAMNEINAAYRSKQAAKEKAEAEKIVLVSCNSNIQYQARTSLHRRDR